MRAFSPIKWLKRHPYVVLVLLLLATVACYCQASAGADERGIITQNNQIQEIVNPGSRHTSLDPYRNWNVVDVGVKQVMWEDPSLLTADEQPIGLRLNIEYRRGATDAGLTQMYVDYNHEFFNDEALMNKVMSKIFNSAKTSSTQLSLNQMLGTEGVNVGEPPEGQEPLDRTVYGIADNTGVNVDLLRGVEGRQLLSILIHELLQRDLDGTNIEIVAVAIDDIAPSAQYIALLERRSNARQEREAVAEERRVEEERLQNEQVTTQIELERAQREQEVNRIKAQILDTSPATLSLQLAQIYASAINAGDVVIYVPPGSSIAEVLGQQGIIPVISSGEVITPEEMQQQIDELLEEDQGEQPDNDVD